MGNDGDPPEDQGACRERINSAIVQLCSVSHVAHYRPTAQGIGLYTHVAGPKTATLNPHFDFVDNIDREVALLPLGGPRRVQPNKNREPLDEEVAALYKEVADAVNAEEKIWRDQRLAAMSQGDPRKSAYTMTLDTLRKKYGDDVAPPHSTVLPLHNKGRDARRNSEATHNTDDGPSKKRKVNFATDSEPRRKSTGDATILDKNANGDRRESRSVNIYNVDRDPRLRGRGSHPR